MLQIEKKTVDEIKEVFTDGASKFPEDKKGLLDYTLWAYSNMVDNPEIVLDAPIVGPKEAENVRGIIFEEMVFFLQEQGIITGDWYGR